MNEYNNAFFAGVIVGLIMGIVALSAGLSSFTEQTKYYKQGQIDCINGKIAYELKVQSDGTTVWDKK